jgi:hypothetical protein
MPSTSSTTAWAGGRPAERVGGHAGRDSLCTEVPPRAATPLREGWMERNNSGEDRYGDGPALAVRSRSAHPDARVETKSQLSLS